MIASQTLRVLSDLPSVPCQHDGCHKFASRCREVYFRRGGLAFYYECEEHSGRTPTTAYGRLDTRWPNGAIEG